MKHILLLLIFLLPLHAEIPEAMLYGKWGIDVYIQFNEDHSYHWQGEYPGDTGTWKLQDSTIILFEGKERVRSECKIEEITPFTLRSTWWPEHTMEKDFISCHTEPQYLDITNDGIPDMLFPGFACLEAFLGKGNSVYELPNETQLINVQYFKSGGLEPYKTTIEIKEGKVVLTIADDFNNVSHQFQCLYDDNQLIVVGEKVSIEDTLTELRDRKNKSIKRVTRAKENDSTLQPAWLEPIPLNDLQLDTYLFVTADSLEKRMK